MKKGIVVTTAFLVLIIPIKCFGMKKDEHPRDRRLSLQINIPKKKHNEKRYGNESPQASRIRDLLKRATKQAKIHCTDGTTVEGLLRHVLKKQDSKPLLFLPQKNKHKLKHLAWSHKKGYKAYEDKETQTDECECEFLKDENCILRSLAVKALSANMEMMEMAKTEVDNHFEKLEQFIKESEDNRETLMYKINAVEKRVNRDYEEIIKVIENRDPNENLKEFVNKIQKRKHQFTKTIQEMKNLLEENNLHLKDPKN